MTLQSKTWHGLCALPDKLTPMKYMITTAALALISVSLASAQAFEENNLLQSDPHMTHDSLAIFVGGINLNDPKTEFIEMESCQVSLGSAKMVALINYGQRMHGLKSREMTDQSGNEIIFYSEIAILNYLYTHGWDMVSVSNSSIPQVYSKVYVLRRKHSD